MACGLSLGHGPVGALGFIINCVNNLLLLLLLVLLCVFDQTAGRVVLFCVIKSDCREQHEGVLDFVLCLKIGLQGCAP